MVITENYKYIVFPIAIILISIYEVISSQLCDNTEYTQYPSNTSYGYYSNAYDTYNTSYRKYQQHLQDSADVEKDAVKKIKRGIKITIEKSN